MNSTPTDADLGAYNASVLPNLGGDVNGDGVFQIILLFLSTILPLTLNPLCLLVLRHVDSIQETTKVFLRSLTAADLGIGICSALPMTISTISGTWVLGDVLCLLQPFATNICFYSTNLSLILLTVDRYISVEYALRYPSIVTVKRAWVAVLCSWGTALLISISDACVHRWIYVYHIQFFQCAFSPSSLATYVFWGVSACTMLCTLTVILVTYIRLFIISRHHARRIQADNHIAGNGHGVRAGSNSKSLHTLLLIVLTASMSTFLPFGCWLLSHVLPPDSINQTAFFLMRLIPFLTNSWLNVVIYYLRNKDIRRATHTLLASYHAFFKQHFPFQRK